MILSALMKILLGLVHWICPLTIYMEFINEGRLGSVSLWGLQNIWEGLPHIQLRYHLEVGAPSLVETCNLGSALCDVGQIIWKSCILHSNVCRFRERDMSGFLWALRKFTCLSKKINVDPVAPSCSWILLPGTYLSKYLFFILRYIGCQLGVTWFLESHAQHCHFISEDRSFPNTVLVSVSSTVTINAITLLKSRWNKTVTCVIKC